MLNHNYEINQDNIDSSYIYTTDNNSSEDESQDSSESDTSDDNDLEDSSQTVAYNFTEKNNHTIDNTNKFLSISHTEYENNRNLLFTKDIEKHSILLDTKNLIYDSETNKYKYVIEFQSSKKKTGFEFYKNIIGFKLLKANIKNTPNVINSMNNKLCINMGGSLDKNDNIINGTNYNIEFTKRDFNDEDDIATFIQDTLTNKYSISGFTVTYHNDLSVTSYSAETHKYQFTNSSSSFILDFEKSYDLGSSIYRLLGFQKKKYFITSGITGLMSEYVSDFSFHYVDVVVPQIPYIACKKNIDRKHIIDRINLDNPSGHMVNYFNTLSTDLTSDNYFYPITLNQLEIQLYSDSTDVLYESENSDNNFEFQITILKNLNLLK